MRRSCSQAAAAATALLLSVALANAAEVTLISVGGVKQALDKIIADYTNQTGNRVKYTVGSPLVVANKLADGEVFDVVVQSAPAIDDYAKLGGVNRETRLNVARRGIGMVMRNEATPPDISTPDAFKSVLRGAKSIAMTDTAMPNGSRDTGAAHFHRGGRDGCDQAQAAGRRTGPGQEQIAKGEIEMGLFNISS